VATDGGRIDLIGGTLGFGSTIAGQNERRDVSAPASPVKAVIVNANDELLHAIGEIARGAGFAVITAKPAEIGAGTAGRQQFLRNHGARVVVLDISPPYRENWAAYSDLRYAEMISGSWRQFVATTADKRALENEAGPTSAIEAAPGRLDQQALTEALQRAILV
jgi:hypothetical protein